jgi:hypothetical protein
VGGENILLKYKHKKQNRIFFRNATIIHLKTELIDNQEEG